VPGLVNTNEMKNTYFQCFLALENIFFSNGKRQTVKAWAGVKVNENLRFSKFRIEKNVNGRVQLSNRFERISVSNFF